MIFVTWEDQEEVEWAEADLCLQWESTLVDSEEDTGIPTGLLWDHPLQWAECEDPHQACQTVWVEVEEGDTIVHLIDDPLLAYRVMIDQEIGQGPQTDLAEMIGTATEIETGTEIENEKENMGAVRVDETEERMIEKGPGFNCQSFVFVQFYKHEIVCNM